ncbi:hypothetical protein MNBD_GAMMA10-1631 [hydrothermal vent metagenome]|uniref:Uncharacterized protein n=1 Tax=hydrothermal vent metagenome TaxID=652676 RepID=A0A3B0XSM5_9ZZZZ
MNDNIPSNVMYYDKTTYGKEFLYQFIGKKIDEVAIIKKRDLSSKFDMFPIEKGILLRFEGVNDGLAIGIHLFPYSGSSHISCIPEDYIGENRDGIPEIVWLD